MGRRNVKAVRQYDAVDDCIARFQWMMLCEFTPAAAMTALGAWYRGDPDWTGTPVRTPRRRHGRLYGRRGRQGGGY